MFNEKADELASSTFVQKLVNDGSKLTFSFNRENDTGLLAERIGPNKNDFKSFLLDYRFFIQDNEVSSFRNLNKLYFEAPISEKSRKWMEVINGDLNDFLDEWTGITHNELPLTRRIILDTFIYGGFAHANISKQTLFKNWQSVPPFFPLVEYEFVNTLSSVLRVIALTKQLNIKVLNEIEKIN